MTPIHAPHIKPIALLVTVCNRQKKLERMLSSLSDELALIDIVLVDDGSDIAVDIKGFADYPIHLIRLDSNQGPAAASNDGLRYILDKPYEYIARLDSDDVVMPGRFAKQLAFLQDNPEIGLLGSSFNLLDTEGKVVGQSYRVYDDVSIRKMMHVSCMLHHSTWMMRSHIVRQCGFYNEFYRVSEDFEYAWRMMKYTKVANLPDILVGYETGDMAALSTRRYYRMTWNGLKIKLYNFNVLSGYSYAGIWYSIMEFLQMQWLMTRIKKWWFT
jgi:glycosyltransferase involved in cell wall biosynthesis